MTRFRWYLLGVLAVSLGLRVGYVLSVTDDDGLAGDQFYYAAIADSLAGGHGFTKPFVAGSVASADHPPLTSVVMVPASWLARRLDIGSTTPQRLTMTLLGAVTVLLVGLAGRDLARVTTSPEAAPDPDRDARPDPGDHPEHGAPQLDPAERAGIGAASLAAISAGLWINDGIVMAESVTAACLALVVWLSIRAWDRADTRSLVWLGAAIGLAGLARAESLLLVVLLLAPLAWRAAPDTRRLGRLAAGFVACAVVLAPWVVPNLVRFDRPVLMSTNDGLTLLGANCPDTYTGPGIGFWSLDCTRLVPADPTADDSTMSGRYRTEALHQIRTHPGALPKVIVVRELRTFGVWDVRFMNATGVAEGRPGAASWLAWGSWWITLALGVFGMVLLRRDGRPWWLIGVHLVAVVVITAAFYGLYRFRIGAEVALLVAGGSAVSRMWNAATAR